MESTTKQFRKRNAILSCLQQTKTHPSAEMVLEMLSDEMGNFFGQMDDADKHDDDEVDSQTATFPLLNQLFGGNTNMPSQPGNNRPGPKQDQPKEEEPGKKKNKKVHLLAKLFDPKMLLLDFSKNKNE